MGVCLYLALMRRVLGSRFRFAVLDDVVMSIDQGHRKQFCTLLKTRFPDTQFIITTHDKVWAKQMQTEGLVDSNGGIVFHSWSVQTGPIFEQLADVWNQIDQDLAKNDVSSAAARLRRHLEYISADLADLLGAKPAFHGDFSYDLGDLLPAVIGRQGELLKLAAKSAHDWNDDVAKTKVRSKR
jgi:energy-coupling factor transporter ATP-binding protein EcfA2